MLIVFWGHKTDSEWYLYIKVKVFHKIMHISKESQIERIAQGKCFSLVAFVEASTMISNDAVIEAK